MGDDIQGVPHSLSRRDRSKTIDTLKTLEEKISVLCDENYWHWRAANGSFCGIATDKILKLSEARKTHRECHSCDRIKYEMTKGW